jgi:hypothetical protein
MKPRTITFALCATTALLMVTALSAPAQLDKLKDTTPEQRAKAQTDLMKAKLSLTSGQAGKVADLNLKYAKKMEPVIKGSAGPFMKMREVKQINQEKEAELKQILSPEQFEKFLAAREEMREKFEERIEKSAQGQE